ncbi:DUF979 domain-containing protein [Kitasatospora sp. NBC_01250]|uniref:DUF979 domain-containing protein n=1 Tax=unclassified Kitasatospora TaxID=2633591 RepID=UPI002E114B3B|nr:MULTISPECIES: DUF979 domain-containing protein [unclassified Kitasatospora]WSJ65388.1 DUF979 domain-containing protein [Kitasatospora sp. NBC_01302]
MIQAEWLYWLIGALFLAVAGQMAVDRSNPKRFGSAAFWGLLGLSFIYGTWVVRRTAPAAPLGAAVLVMICLAGFGLTGRGASRAPEPEQRAATAARLGNRVFVPALTIPLVAVLCSTVVKDWHLGNRPVLQAGSETIVGLGIGALVALLVALLMTRERKPVVALHAGRGLLESMGWALLLPQLLAVLGSIFQVAGVGTQVGRLTTDILPHGSRFPAVVLYCVGMALFTVIMGNAFAAFPVMTAAIGWPVLVTQLHGNPAVVLAVGMLAGFCGTLVTPMAANFNLVPAALLELKDQYGPIKAQVRTAGALLVCNIAIISLFAF